MKYSDSVKAILFAAIDELASHPEEYAQKPGRKRNEYSAFCQMVDAASSGGPMIIYICDRGMHRTIIMHMLLKTASIS